MRGFVTNATSPARTPFCRGIAASGRQHPLILGRNLVQEWSAMLSLVSHTAWAEQAASTPIFRLFPAIFR